MTDWTTCRVVRDRDERLWMRYGTRSWESEDPGEPDTNTAGLGSNYGPLTPVLDADGLPVVHTVGDLTARHLRRDISVAWDEGVDFVTRHPGMSAEYVRAANPYRQTEGNRA